MTVDAIGAGLRSDAPGTIQATEPTRFDDFARWLDGELRTLDVELRGAENTLREFAVGEGRSIHHVMMALEKARLSLMLAVQVRNKALEAYQEIMRMQV